MGDLACYDFEEAKRLKLYETDCNAAYEVNKQLRLKTKALETLAYRQGEAIVLYKVAVNEYARVSKDDWAMIEGLEQDVAEEYRWSVRGGAFHWVAGAIILSAAAGFATGYYVFK